MNNKERSANFQYPKETPLEGRQNRSHSEFRLTIHEQDGLCIGKGQICGYLRIMYANVTVRFGQSFFNQNEMI